MNVILNRIIFNCKIVLRFSFLTPCISLASFHFPGYPYTLPSPLVQT